MFIRQEVPGRDHPDIIGGEKLIRKWPMLGIWGDRVLGANQKILVPAGTCMLCRTKV
jgi:hypothetical protein